MQTELFETLAESPKTKPKPVTPGEAVQQSLQQKDMPELPEEWKWVKLSQAVQVLDNLRRPINSSERQIRVAGKNPTQLYPYYGATGQVGWIDSYLTDGEYILVGEDGAPFLEFAKEKAYRIKGKTWVNNHAHILKEISGKTINLFILHYLNSIDYRNYVNGTTRLKLTKGSMVEIPFPLPPLPIQQTIVSKIEELFSGLDKSIECLKTAQQQLKVYRQAVLKWAFEGKLHTAEANLVGAIHESPLQDLPLTMAAEPSATYGEIEKPKLPEGWKWVKLGELIESINSGKSFKCDERPPNSGEVGIVKVSSVTWGVFDEQESKTCFSNDLFKESYAIKKGDFLFSRANTIDLVGACVIVQNIEKKLMLSDKILRFSFYPKVNKEFVLNFLRSRRGRKEIESLSSGNQDSMRNIGQERIKQISIPFCDFENQGKVVAAIEYRLSVADQMEESIRQSLDKAEALRQSILKKAFEGKLI